MRVEALAEEFEARMAPFDQERTSRFAWNLTARPSPIAYHRQLGERAMTAFAGKGNSEEDFRARDAAVRATDRESEEWVGDALTMDWLRARLWQRERPGEESPLTPLLAIWRAGYMLDTIWFGWRLMVAREVG